MLVGDVVTASIAASTRPSVMPATPAEIRSVRSDILRTDGGGRLRRSSDENGCQGDVSGEAAELSGLAARPLLLEGSGGSDGPVDVGRSTAGETRTIGAPSIEVTSISYRTPST